MSIPNSVTNLGTAAFYTCVALTRVAIPGSIAFIQDYASAECYRLAEVDMSPGVTRIGECSFRSYPVTNVAIPEGVTNIGSSAIHGCHSLTSVGIPGSVQWIGERAFSDCLSLEDLNMSEGVAWIGEAAFQSCRNLDRVTIPGSVTNIGRYAFQGCIGITDITIPDGVFTIGDYAFRLCPALSSVIIPRTVIEMGVGPFADCERLMTISVDADNSHLSSVNGVLFGTHSSWLIQYPGGRVGDFIVPTGVAHLGDSCFSASELTGVTLADTVRSIGNYAFSSCYRLTSVRIPGGVNSIGAYAFANCRGLTSVAVAAGVGAFGDYGFAGCVSLTSITVPVSVTNVGYYEFAGCSSLTNIYFTGDAPSGGKPAFDDSYRALVYYLPDTLGWTPSFVGRPTVLWNPTPQSSGPDFGVGSSGFGFTVAGTPRIRFVLEASASIDAAVWIPLQTNTLVETSLQVSDPEWASYPMRFYRLRSP